MTNFKSIIDQIVFDHVLAATRNQTTTSNITNNEPVVLPDFIIWIYFGILTSIGIALNGLALKSMFTGKRNGNM